MLLQLQQSYTTVPYYDMLVKKYKNNEYEGSKVIYYGEDVPDIYKKKVDDPGMEHRRVKYEE